MKKTNKQSIKKCCRNSELLAWDLSDLYNGIDDKQIDADLELYRKSAISFAKKYKGKLESLSASQFFAMAKTCEERSVLGNKIGVFAYLNMVTQMKNAEAMVYFKTACDIKRGKTDEGLNTFELNDVEWCGAKFKQAIFTADQNNKLNKVQFVTELSYICNVNDEDAIYKACTDIKNLAIEAANVGERLDNDHGKNTDARTTETDSCMTVEVEWKVDDVKITLCYSGDVQLIPNRDFEALVVGHFSLTYELIQ